MKTTHIQKIAARVRASGKLTKTQATVELRAAQMPLKLAGEVVALATWQGGQALKDRRARRWQGWNGSLALAWNRRNMPSAVLAKSLDLSLPLRLRHEVARVAGATRAAKEALRMGAAGGDNITIRATADPTQVGYRYFADRAYPYKGRYRTYGAVESNHDLTIPEMWLSRVQWRGLAVLGGLMTLDASPVDSQSGVELYAATWLGMGRGYEGQDHEGFIAVRRVDGNVVESYHGTTVDTALRGLARKVKIRGGLSRGGHEWLAARVPKRADRMVSVAAVRAQGACEYGIRAWAARVGLTAEYEAGAATVAQVWAGYQLSPAPEARRALVSALR